MARAHAVWPLLPTGEAFISFAAFPWFRDATIGRLQDVQLLHREHRYWTALDVDLALEAISHPERYPLVSRGGSSKPLQRAVGAGKVSEKRAAGRRAAGR